MTSHPEFYILSGTASTETEIKKSKFIATITVATSKKETVSFFQKIRDLYPGANHNCYAYIIGSPKSPEDIGFSDDGEPSGTAGKPILSVLQHNNIGNVAIIVTRFFGGTKLGTGRLVRAYSAVVKSAVEAGTLNGFVQSRRIQIFFPFQFENNVRHILATHNLAVIDSAYSEDVMMELDVPESLLSNFQDQLKDITKGLVRFDQ